MKKISTSAAWELALLFSLLTWSSHLYWATPSFYWTMVRFVAFFPVTVFAYAFIVALVETYRRDIDTRRRRSALRRMR